MTNNSKKSQYICFRNWLKRNKILFETIVALLLSIMAIFVSIGAWQTSSYQTQIMEQENQPAFSFSFENSTSPTFLYYQNNSVIISIDDTDFVDGHLIIKNTGKPFSQITETHYSIFMQIAYLTGGPGYHMERVRIPLEDYILDDVTTNFEGDSQIPSFWGDGNITSGKFSTALNGYIRYAENRGDQFVNVKIMRYLKISYTDIFGKNHINYYYVSRTGSNQLSENDYKKIINSTKESSLPINSMYITLMYGADGENWQDKIGNNTFFDKWYLAMHDVKKYGI